jgi:hypothetical protein
MRTTSTQPAQTISARGGGYCIVASGGTSFGDSLSSDADTDFGGAAAAGFGSGAFAEDEHSPANAELSCARIGAGEVADASGAAAQAQFLRATVCDGSAWICAVPGIARECGGRPFAGAGRVFRGALARVGIVGAARAWTCIASRSETGKRVATLSMETKLRFRSAEEREKCAEELRRAVFGVVARHSGAYTTDKGKAADGRPFRLVLGCYPVPEEEPEKEMTHD